MSVVATATVPDPVRGWVFTLLDVSWNAMRLLSLALGGWRVDTISIQPLFWPVVCCAPWPTLGARATEPR